MNFAILCFIVISSCVSLSKIGEFQNRRARSFCRKHYFSLSPFRCPPPLATTSSEKGGRQMKAEGWIALVWDLTRHLGIGMSDRVSFNFVTVRCRDTSSFSGLCE